MHTSGRCPRRRQLLRLLRLWCYQTKWFKPWLVVASAIAIYLLAFGTGWLCQSSLAHFESSCNVDWNRLRWLEIGWEFDPNNSNWAARRGSNVACGLMLYRLLIGQRCTNRWRHNLWLPRTTRYQMDVPITVSYQHSAMFDWLPVTWSRHVPCFGLYVSLLFLFIIMIAIFDFYYFLNFNFF